MVKSIADSLLELAREGVFIKNVCANAYTPSGEALCKTFKMEYVCHHVDRGKIYSAPLSSILQEEIFDDQEELRQLYSRNRSSSM
jgi:hypothetical protein